MSETYLLQSIVLQQAQKFVGEENFHSLPGLDATVLRGVSYLTNQAPSLLARLCSRFTTKAPQSNAAHELRIPETFSMQGLCSRSNLIYESFAWFITEQEPCSGGRMVAFRPAEGQQRILPEDLCRHKFIWDGHEMEYQFITKEKKEDKDKTSSERHVMLYSSTAKVLLRFPQKLCDLYTEVNNKEDWQQYLYTHTTHHYNPGNRMHVIDLASEAASGLLCSIVMESLVQNGSVS